MSLTVAVVGRDRDRDPGPVERGQRMGREVGDDARLDVAGRAQVEGHVARPQQRHHLRVAGGGHTVGDAPHPEGRAPRRCARAPGTSPAWAVSARPPSLGRHEGRRVGRRRVRLLRPGEVEADDRRPEGGGRLGEPHVGCRRVAPHGGHDEADERSPPPETACRLGDAVDDRRDHLVDREPRLEVEAGRPAQLRVPHSVVGEVGDELGADTGQRRGGLEQRDRQVEVRQQLRLVAAVRRRHESLAGVGHARERDPGARGQLDRGRGAHGAVDVLVQLRLRQPPQLRGKVHLPMIGPGVVARAVAAVALAGVPFALRAGPAFLADPPRFAHGVDAATVALAGARAQVDTALASVAAAIDATRQASISASTDASLDVATFAAAASAVRASAAPIAAAAAAIQRARGMLAPFEIRLGPLGTDGDRAAGIGDGVDAARASAAGFIALRTNATAVLEALRRSATALGRVDAAGASAAADEAAAALDSCGRTRRRCRSCGCG